MLSIGRNGASDNKKVTICSVQELLSSQMYNADSDSETNTYQAVFQAEE